MVSRMRLESRWRVKGLSLTQRRAWVGVALAPAVLLAANSYMHWFGDALWQRRLAAIGFAVLFAVMLFVGPTVQEIEAYRDAKRESH